MGYELRSLEADEQFTSNNGFWSLVLDLAQNNGWNPEGTIDGMHAQEIGLEKVQADNVRNLNGYYCGGFIEIVTKSDANKLADALEKALLEGKGNTNTISKTGIKEVIELCRHGAFEVI
jgi:hypothetical protein